MLGQMAWVLSHFICYLQKDVNANKQVHMYIKLDGGIKLVDGGGGGWLRFMYNTFRMNIIR